MSDAGCTAVYKDFTHLPQPPLVEGHTAETQRLKAKQLAFVVSTHQPPPLPASCVKVNERIFSFNTHPRKILPKSQWVALEESVTLHHTSLMQNTHAQRHAISESRMPTFTPADPPALVIVSKRFMVRIWCPYLSLLTIMSKKSLLALLAIIGYITEWFDLTRTSFICLLQLNILRMYKINDWGFWNLKKKVFYHKLLLWNVQTKETRLHAATRKSCTVLKLGDNIMMRNTRAKHSCFPRGFKWEWRILQNQHLWCLNTVTALQHSLWPDRAEWVRRWKTCVWVKQVFLINRAAGYSEANQQAEEGAKKQPYICLRGKGIADFYLLTHTCFSFISGFIFLCWMSSLFTLHSPSCCLFPLPVFFSPSLSHPQSLPPPLPHMLWCKRL